MVEWQGAEYREVSQLQQWLADESLASLVVDGSEHVLDVGCGDGRITAEIASRVAAGTVLGVDPSHDMVDFARRTHAAGNLSFAVGDARTLAYRATFDLVVSFNALHWVHEQEAALRSIHTALRPRGRAWLQLVSRGERKPLEDVVEEVCTQPRWAASFVGHRPPHVHFRPEEYRALAEQAGFHVAQLDVVQRTWDFESRDAFARWAHATFVAWTSAVPADRRDDFIAEVLDRYGSDVFIFYQLKTLLRREVDAT